MEYASKSLAVIHFFASSFAFLAVALAFPASTAFQKDAILRVRIFLICSPCCN